MGAAKYLDETGLMERRIEGLLTQAFEMLLQLRSQQCPRVQHLQVVGPAPPPTQLSVKVEPTAHSGTAYHVAHIPRCKTCTPFVAPSKSKLLDEVNIWIKDKVIGRPPGTILFHRLNLRLPKVEVVMSDTRELASVRRCQLNATYMIRVLTLPNYHSMFVRLFGNGQARRFQAWHGGELGFTDKIIASESGLDSRGDNVSGPVSTRKRKRTAIFECSGSSSDTSLTNVSTSDEESDEDDEEEEDIIHRTCRKENASDESSRKRDDHILSQPRRSIRTKWTTGINYQEDSDTTDGLDSVDEEWDPKEDRIAPHDFIPLGRSCVPQVPKLRRTMPIRVFSPGKHPRNPPQVQAHSQIFKQRPISIKRSSSPEIKHAPSPEIEEISGEHWTSNPRRRQSKPSSTLASSLSTSQEDEVTFHFHTTRTNTTIPRPMSSCSTMLSFFDEVLSAWTTTFPQSRASEASVGGGGQGRPKGVLMTFEGGKREVYVPWKSADAWGAMMRGIRRGRALDVDVRCVGEGV